MAPEDQRETEVGVEKRGQREKLGKKENSAIRVTRGRKVEWAILDLKDQLGRLDLRVPLDLFLYFDRPRVPGGTPIPVVTTVVQGVAVKQSAQLASMWLDLVSIRGVVLDVTTLVSTVVLLPKGWNFVALFLVNMLALLPSEEASAILYCCLESL